MAFTSCAPFLGPLGQPAGPVFAFGEDRDSRSRQERDRSRQDRCMGKQSEEYEIADGLSFFTPVSESCF
jgi:hypothetical protein